MKGGIVDNWHSVKWSGILTKCACPICEQEYICPICDYPCVNREEFDWHFKRCDKEMRKEKEE